MNQTDPRLLLLSSNDNILVLIGAVAEGETIVIDGIACVADASLVMGHKLARRDIRAGEKVLKYGLPIGTAAQPIRRGSHAHVHNIQSGYTTVELME